jgi:hypothetical protein
MSTTPNVAAVEVPPNIREATTLLAKRLLPAKLKVDGAEGKKNGFYFNSWVIRKGLALATMTGQAIADELYRAIQQDCTQQLPQLVWTNPPKALTTRTEQHKGPITRQDVRTASDFEAKVRQSEEADKAQRAQEAAKKRATELVDRFAPINHRRGVLNFELRDTKVAEWKKKIEKTTDFIALERAIADDQRAIYQKLERAAEKL